MTQRAHWLGILARAGGRLVRKGVLVCLVALVALLDAGAAHAQAEVRPQIPDTLSLADCVALALDNNPDVQRAREEVARSLAQTGKARSPLLPYVSVGGSYSRSFSPDNDQYRTSLSVTQNIYEGGGNWAQWAGSKASAEYYRSNEKSATQDLVLFVKTAYYGILRAKALVGVAEKNIERSTEALRRAKAMEEVGSGTRADVLKAQVELSVNELNMISARNDLYLAWITLYHTMGLEEVRPVEIGRDLRIKDRTIDLDEAIERALKNHPDLAAAEALAEAGWHSIRVAKAGRWPSLKAGYSYSTQTSEWTTDIYQWRDGDISTLSLTLSFPLFDGLSTKNSIREAEASYRAYLRDVQKRRLDVVQGVRTAHAGIEEARARMVSTEQVVLSATENLRLATERYNLGAGTMLERIDAQVVLAGAEVERIESAYDYMLTWAEMERALGE